MEGKKYMNSHTKEINNDTLNTLVEYASVWGWQIQAILFFCFSVILLAIPRTIFSLVLGIAFFFIFIVCEFVMIRRRREFNENHKVENN